MTKRTEPAHFISLGAGVQSTVMLLMADRGNIAPLPAAALFADTGWEPSKVYQQLTWLKTEVHNIPVITVNEGRSLYEESWNGRTNSGRHDTIIPAHTVNSALYVKLLASRECTREYKVRPIQREIGRRIDRPKGSRQTEPRAVQWLGISTDEAIRVKPSDRSWIDNRWPLVEMGWSRHDCIEWFRQQYPGLELVKSSCVGCGFHSDAEWLRLSREQPEDMETAYALDERLRSPQRPTGNIRGSLYLHRSAVPLRQAIANLEKIAAEGRQLSMFDGFGNECAGHCGV